MLGLALWSVDALWWWLELLGQWQFAQWSRAAPSGWALIAALCGLIWLLSPRGIPNRWAGVVGFMPLFFVSPVALPLNVAKVALLDVGQGLASVVQTQNHVLVFDAGPRFSSGFNTGEAMVSPYLLAQGRGRIDTLIVSHGDNDHIGGVAALLESMPVQQVLSSELEKLNSVDAQLCEAGQQWDGVQFAILNPAAVEHARGRSENNRSCVLRVQAGGDSVLLTGDIEQAAEWEMIQRLPEKLQSSVLVVPHHGSKTSSSAAFVAAVSPGVVLFPVGYRNRYGFPKPQIVQRYRDRNIRLYDSAEHGAVEFRLGGKDGVGEIQTYRQSAIRYWHDQPAVETQAVVSASTRNASDRSATLLQ